jgi:uncharacterized protein
MLVQFRVGNYRSFREPQTLSLAASGDRTHPDNLIPWGKKNLLKAAAVFGANASGKSNLLNALGFMSWFVRDSATRMNVGDEIPVVPFRLSLDSQKQPSLFEVQLVLNETRYDYGFCVSRERIHHEYLIAYPSGRPQRWFERRWNVETQETTWRFRGGQKRTEDLVKATTRDNGLALCRGADLNVDQWLPVFIALAYDLRVFDFSQQATTADMLKRTAARFREDERFRGVAMQLVRDADLGIEGIRIEDSAGLPAAIHSVHSVAGASEVETFSFDEAESAGTQRLFAILGPWLDCLENAGLLAVDELDCSMHPLLMRGLIELFQSAKWNAEGAQLIFATHDNTLMNQSLLRRDQIWLVEKDADQASRLFSLYDFAEKPRKGEAIHRGYLAGRYGGVPTLGATFEEVEFR